MWLSVARFVELLLHFLPLFGKEIRKRSALISATDISGPVVVTNFRIPSPFGLIAAVLPSRVIGHDIAKVSC